MVGIGSVWYAPSAVSVAPRAHHGPHSVSAVVLGPLLGPIVGGGLTQAFGWRAVFWFLAVFAVLCTIPLIFFPETYRRERSLTYQAALRKSRERENKKVEAAKDARQCALACPESPDDESSSEARSQCVETKVNVDLEAHLSKVDNSSKPKEVKISLTDVDPIRPTINVLRCPNNVVIFLSSGAVLILRVRGVDIHIPFRIIGRL